MTDYLNKIGISNLENIVFRKINNKYNHLTAQEFGTTIPSNASNNSIYSVKNSNGVSELYFNGQQLTQSGGIGSNIWEIDANNNSQIIPLNNKNVSINKLDITDVSNIIFSNNSTTTSDKKLYTIDDNGTIKLYFGDTQIDSPHTTAYWNLTGSTLQPNGQYNINMEINSNRGNIENIGNLTAESFGLIGSTRSITNIETLTFNGSNKSITDLNTLNFVNTGSPSINNLINLNSLNGDITNLTLDNLLGGKSDGTRNYIEIPDQNYLISPEIQINNNNGTAKLYANEIRIGSVGNNQDLNTYITSNRNTNFATMEGKAINSGIGGSILPYLTSCMVPQKVVSGYDDYAGLFCNVIEVDTFAHIHRLVCDEFYASPSDGGSDFFDFFSGAGSIIGGIGSAIGGAGSVVQGGLILGGAVVGSTAGLIAVGIATSGNGKYNQKRENWTESKWDEASRENGMTTSEYDTFNPRPDGVEEQKQICSFSVNPRSGRLTIATWGQTEDAVSSITGANLTQFCDSGYINSHDQQYTIKFKNYSSTSDYANARYSPTTTFNGGNLIWTGYDNRLVNIDNRLYFNGNSNKLAYTSEIETSYWEISGGYLQPNSASGVKGKIQINSNNINLYDDIYLSSGNNFNFISATKGQIKYDDTAKSLIFRNSDSDGEYVFNDYNNIARFKIDITNNRLEIPQGSLFFQESADQKINKVGSTNLIFQTNSYDIATFNSPASSWTFGYEYPVLSLQDNRLDNSSTARSSTQLELISPNSTGQLYLRCDNGANGDYTNVFYSRRQGGSGNQYNYFFDTPKTKFNNIQLTDVGINLLNSGIEFSSNVGIDALFWNGDIILTDDNPNISNRITFSSITLTNSGLESNGGNLYWNGSKLNGQVLATEYFSDDGTTATSSNLDFYFTQDLEVNGILQNNNQNVYLGATSGGGHNLVMNLPSGSNNSFITINSGQRFINYNANTDKGLYISHQGGLDSENNIQFQLHNTPTTYFKIDDTNSTFSTNLILDATHNITLNQGDITLTDGNLTLTDGDIDGAGNWKIRSSNVATNVCNISQSDTTLSLALSGGSNPDTYLFKDYNSATILKVKRDDLQFLGSDTNTKFALSSSQVNSYNPFYANDIYARSGSDLILGLNGTEKIKLDNTNNRVNITPNVLIGGGTHYGALTINSNNSVAGTNFTTYSYYFYSGLAPSASSSQLGTGSYSLAIHSNGWINCWGVMTFSDKRIKRNIKECCCSLKTINKLNVVNYEYIDELKQKGERCGFIAQQIEEILPNAVKTSRNFIPDYYKIVDKVSDNCIKLGKHDYIVGDKLKLLNDDKEFTILVYRIDIQYIYFNVVGESGNVIIPDCNNKYFLYGKEVNDFKQIDNDYLNAVSIKGVQELFKQNNELENKMKNLCLKLGVNYCDL